MNRYLKTLAAVAGLVLLVSCGGTDNAGTPLFGGGGSCPTTPASGASSTCPTSSATSVDVLASAVQVGSGGDTVTITAVVKGVGNVGLATTPVTFSADTGTLTNAAASTDASGTATATFSAGSNRSDRTAHVTVTSGSATGTISLDIVGTVLSYSGVTTVPLNGAVSVSAKAVDSKGAVISGLPLTISSSLGNGLSATSATTDSQGNASVTYTAVNPGTDNLQFAGGGVSVSTPLQISAADFKFVSPAAGTQIPVSTSQAVTVRYFSNNAPVANQQINFAATAGTVTPATKMTDSSGMATVLVQSASASPAVVQATVAGQPVQATLPVVFIAQTPAKLVLQVTPTAIGPNPGGATAQQAQLVATVTDPNGNPVSGATVNFNRIADPSGGNLSQASAVTDLSGQATVQYIAGSLTTANNGVQLQADVPGAGGQTITGMAQLTVNQSALFIALGTGNTINNLDEQTYEKDWVVYVTDANGIAVPNVSLTIKVLPTRYRKGGLLFQSGSWSYAATVVTCLNEDVNYNGTLDPGEDFNLDGRLEPGNVIAVTTAETPAAGATGIAKTDASGRATITLIYAESYAPWVEVSLVAQAVVSGTESSNQATFFVAGAASDFNNAAIPPAGAISPFGVNDCSTPN